MKDLLKTNLLIGLGLASMTSKKIKELGAKLAEESKLSKEEGDELLEDILKQSEEAKKDLENRISKAVEKALGKIELPCSSRLTKIDTDLQKLQESVDRLAGKPTQ